MAQLIKKLLNLSLLVSFIAAIILSSCQSKEQHNEELNELNNKNDLPINKAIVSEFELSMQNQGLVNILELDSNIIVDLKYSSTDNFFSEDVYGTLENAYLQSEVAASLSKANKALMSDNPDFRLIIYDGARPLSVQKILWDKLDSIPPNKRKDFVADPSEGSIHNYGCAVDLSIYDTKTKRELDMGTKYDFFGPLAYPRLENQMLIEGRLNAENIENRKLLRDLMRDHGFSPITSEWWHFNFYSRKEASKIHQIVL